MRVVFFGTSGFAVPTLRALAGSEHDVTAVVTQPPRPAGRGRQPHPSPVEPAAVELGLEVLRPEDPAEGSFVHRLAGLAPDLAVLVAYGHILKPALLKVPRLGFINLHPSLLPRYRGAAPVQRALMDGASETGVTVIRMDAQVDAGDVLDRVATPVADDETAGELLARLATEGAGLVLRILTRLADGTDRPEPQDPSLATPARKIRDRERVIDWTEPARTVHNRIRALSPVPGAYTGCAGRRLLVYRSRPLDSGNGSPPGTVAPDRKHFVVSAGTGAVELLEVRPEGGRTQSGTGFLNGHRLEPGSTLGKR